MWTGVVKITGKCETTALLFCNVFCPRNKWNQVLWGVASLAFTFSMHKHVTAIECDVQYYLYLDKLMATIDSGPKKSMSGIPSIVGITLIALCDFPATVATTTVNYVCILAQIDCCLYLPPPTHNRIKDARCV
jgi:hypothetical protein